MARWVLPLLLLAAAAQLPDTRTVYVTVVTDKGAAVPDLTPADFEVKVEGRVRPVLSATQPVGPLTIAVLLDDKGGDINEIRVGLATLLSRVEGHAEVSLTTVMPSIVKVFDFTSNGAELRAGLRRLVFRPGPSGGLLLQAISEAADDLHKREAARPAIVVLTFEGQEYRSHTPAEAVLASLERSRALMHVVAVGKPEMQRMVSRAVLEQQEAEGVRGDDWAVDQNNRNAVLGDGPKH